MPGKCRGMQGNAREMEGNGGECQRNIWVAAKCKKDTGECNEMPWGKYGFVCKVPGVCRGMPGEMGEGISARECRGM